MITEYRTCVVCEEEIPAARGKSITCSPDCSAINHRDNPPVYGPLPHRRVYDYPETEYSRSIAKLGWNQVQAARMLGIGPRSSRRYAAGDVELDGPLKMLLRILVFLKKSDDWIEKTTQKEAD